MHRDKWTWTVAALAALVLAAATSWAVPAVDLKATRGWQTAGRPELEKAVALLEEAEITYDRTKLQLAIDGLTKLAGREPENPVYPYYLARAHFPLINIHDYANDAKTAQEVGEKGILFLQTALRLDETGNPDAYRLLGDFYGRLSSFKGVFTRMRYGSRSMKYHQKALELAPDSFLAVIGDATDKLYAPSAFGGDVKKAVTLFRKAIAIDGGSPLGYVWLAKAYVKQEKYDLARQQFEKALAVSPRSAFARNEFDRAEGLSPKKARADAGR